MFQNRSQDGVCTHYTTLMDIGLTFGPKMEEVTAVCKKNCLTRGSTTCTAEYSEGDQIREDHMGEGPMYTRVWWGTLWETGGMKDLEIYKIILKSS